jgi:hypothetical protein
MKYKVKFSGVLLGRDIEKTIILNFVPAIEMRIFFYARGAQCFPGLVESVSYHEKGKFFEVKLDFTYAQKYYSIEEKDIEAISKLWKIR